MYIGRKMKKHLQSILAGFYCAVFAVIVVFYRLLLTKFFLADHSVMYCTAFLGLLFGVGTLVAFHKMTQETASLKTTKFFRCFLGFAVLSNLTYMYFNILFL